MCCSCCCRCPVRTKAFWCFGCSAFVCVVAIIIALLWPILYTKVVYSQLQLDQGSFAYDNWMEAPVPIYLEVHLFNWTNAEHVNDPSVRPHFDELGPYVFRERRLRETIVWHPENGTVSFNQTRVWHFVPEMSVGSLDDEVRTLNVIAASTAYTARDMSWFSKFMLNAIMKESKATLMGTRTVRELIFDGYDDKLLDLLRMFYLSSSYPFDRFAWFYGRNDSVEYDGRLNMFTGSERLGEVYSWNGANRTKFYRDECDKVGGSTGELWPPMTSNDGHNNRRPPLQIFTTDLCRRLPLDYQQDVSVLGRVQGAKWVGTERMLDNGDKYPEMACYCPTKTTDVCPDLKPGVADVSACRFGAPMFVSYPHFYLADESYQRGVEGMRPQREAHQFRMTLEPNTGILLDIEARLQVNILLQPIKNIDLYEDVPKLMVPMMWFTQRAAITEDLADQVGVLLMASKLGAWIGCSLTVLAGILLMVGIVLRRSVCEIPMMIFDNECEE